MKQHLIWKTAILGIKWCGVADMKSGLLTICLSIKLQKFCNALANSWHLKFPTLVVF